MVPEQDVLTISTIWSQLAQRAEQDKSLHLADLFAADKTRFDRFSLECSGLLADFSKQRLTDEGCDLLVKLADERRENVARVQVEVVVRSVQIRGHR